MSNFGIFASRFEVNNKALQQFDIALDSIKRDNADIKKYSLFLLRVLKPIVEMIKEKLSESTYISESNVLDRLKEMHGSDWNKFKQSILEIYSQLDQDQPKLKKQDIAVLNDIGDALDSECANLFQKMRGNG